MKPKPRHAHLLLAASALLACVPALCEDLVRGQVVKFGAPASAPGIGAVRVVLKDAVSGDNIASTNTLDDGSYELRAPSGRKMRAVLSFSKNHYYRNPTEQPLEDPARPQPTVYLSQSGFSAGDAKVSVTNILAVKSSAGFAPYVSAVSSLPPKEKSALFSELKLQDAGAYRSFIEADRTYQEAQALSSKIKAGNEAFRAVHVYPSFGDTGTVRLYGSVPDTASKKEIEQMTMEIKGVTRVQNDLAVLR